MQFITFIIRLNKTFFEQDLQMSLINIKGPDHLQKNLFLKNHKSFAMPKKISKT